MHLRKMLSVVAILLLVVAFTTVAARPAHADVLYITQIYNGDLELIDEFPTNGAPAVSQGAPYDSPQGPEVSETAAVGITTNTATGESAVFGINVLPTDLPGDHEGDQPENGGYLRNLMPVSMEETSDEGYRVYGLGHQKGTRVAALA